MGDALRVEMDAVSWAARLAEWNTRRMIFLADRWVSSSQFEGLAKRTIRYLSSQGGKASRRQIMRKFHINLRDAEMLLRLDARLGRDRRDRRQEHYYLP